MILSEGVISPRPQHLAIRISLMATNIVSVFVLGNCMRPIQPFMYVIT